ncbi:MAG: hypothetical protein A2189_05235 [Paenibacillus sp. RIFOXYA1_FULL_44_5]|nr:MAG: hypothetical protein A2189_05235 [Paenibacillus sp. RIFOXYA1_FULL_44_5]
MIFDIFKFDFVLIFNIFVLYKIPIRDYYNVHNIETSCFVFVNRLISCKGKRGNQLQFDRHHEIKLKVHMG